MNLLSFDRKGSAAKPWQCPLLSSSFVLGEKNEKSINHLMLSSLCASLMVFSLRTLRAEHLIGQWGKRRQSGPIHQITSV